MNDIEGPLSQFSTFAYRGRTLRRKCAAWHNFDMVWLYRSPIPVGSRGVFYSFHLGIWRTVQCRLWMKCYGTGQWGWGCEAIPPHRHSLAGSVTINAKTTVHCSPGSSMTRSNDFYLPQLRLEDGRTGRSGSAPCAYFPADPSIFNIKTT